MVTTVFTSRDFNQDTARAKKAARGGPVVITDRGRPAHVLLTYERYLALVGERANIVELLAMDDAEDVAFEPATVRAAFEAVDFDR